MMNNVTIEKLQALKLFGMADELERQLTTPTAHELPFEHRVRSMVDHECQRRLNIDPPCRSNIDPGRVANS